ncbi:uncharacterized protein TNCV_2758591 [Trichonephila clavipes]|nr:uncharacterized protein TNCV_2758591 [Trichonephila clavipes]
MITTFSIPELNNHDVQELWFQQDGATCHTARATIDLLKDTFGDRLISRFGPVNWPPRSCDLTPPDYFLWGYVKSLVYADKPQTLDHLEDNICRVIADIRPQMLEKVIENWTSRLDSIRASRGKNPPKNTCFELELLQPCSKKEDPVTLRQKGLETIAILSQDNFAIAYTDGSSDRSLSNGGAGIILLLPDAIEAIRNGETNISCDIITLLEQLHNKENPVSCNGYPHMSTLRVMNVQIASPSLSRAKEARDIEHKCTTITLDDANAVAKHRIMNHTFKKPLVTEFDCPRIITSTIARLGTEHLKGMKIHPDKTRSYVQCKHCPDLQLTPNHILECPTVATKLLKMGMVPLRDSLRELLYSPDAPRIAEAVIKTFDGI